MGRLTSWTLPSLLATSVVALMLTSCGGGHVATQPQHRATSTIPAPHSSQNHQVRTPRLVAHNELVASSPHWSISPSPSVGSAANTLDGVSCVTSAFCKAVGTDGGTLIESWNGRVWSIDPSPNSAQGHDTLASVSCVSASFCMAVGYADNAPANARWIEGATTLAESWNGASWTIVPSPDVPSPNGEDNVLAAVSCVSSHFCKAVGGGDLRTLIETWNGTDWSIDPSRSRSPSSLLSVSCVSPTFCKAVGFPGYLMESWDGKVWTTDANHRIPISTVSCRSATMCVGVGAVEQSSISVGIWNGKTWSNVNVPAHNLFSPAALAGVSCASATSCVAVGYYMKVFPLLDLVPRAFIESWHGKAWTFDLGPNLSGGDQLSDKLLAVSCLSSGSCRAVGSKNNSTFVVANG